MATENPESKRKGGGGKLTRTETVTVRLDPKLRYLAELAARKQRRTVSSFIEWAVEESLNRVVIDEDKTFDGHNDKSIADVAADLWDVDDPDRFAKLAIRYPDMLTHEEQTLWKLVRENGLLWKGRNDKVSGEWTWRIEESSLIFERLREHWETFRAVANGTEDRSSLPMWKKTSEPAKPATTFDDFDNDIPF